MRRRSSWHPLRVLVLLALAGALLVPTASAVNLCPVVTVPIATVDGQGNDGAAAGGSAGAFCEEIFDLATGDNQQEVSTGDGGDGGESGAGGIGGAGGHSGDSTGGSGDGGAGGAGAGGSGGSG
ncbi:MAG TPA: hypothetical protein VM754_09170, partial [Actinomycetota bacterium]|nr:hypothetical protein [Actinomycetota bacterium]